MRYAKIKSEKVKGETFTPIKLEILIESKDELYSLFHTITKGIDSTSSQSISCQLHAHLADLWGIEDRNDKKIEKGKN